MRALRTFLGGALAVLASTLGPAALAKSPAAAPPAFAVGTPAGFDDLVREQRAMVDVFFGGRQVATAEAVFSPGSFRFVDGDALARSIPGIADADMLAAALTSPHLDDHRRQGCTQAPARGAVCGALRPEVAGIVFSEARYRVDLFVNPALLTTRAAAAGGWLDKPAAGFSLTSALGGAISGAQGGKPQFSFGNFTIFGFGAGRVRAETTWSSAQGVRSDTLVAEVDGKGWRASAGAFHAPGNEFTGRRKIVGLSFASQLDTRADRDQLQGIPLVVFLDQRSRVDVLVSGRLVGTALYEAGNQALDTSQMPEGTYEVILRITGINGARREERRLFTRSARVPPKGRDLWLATGGFLLEESSGPFPLGTITRTPFAQLGWAHRVSARLAINTGLIGTDERQFALAGATVIGRRFQLDASAMLSARGDHGFYLHLGSQPGGRLSYNIDARRVSSRDSRPFVPEASTTPVWIGTQAFGPDSSYTQIGGDIAWQAGLKRFALVGSWRRANGESRYAIGPSVRIPLIRKGGFELVASADYAFTERGRGGFVGISLFANRGNRTFSAETGLRQAPGTGHVSAAGNLRASLSGSAGALGEFQAGATLSRDDNASLAAADFNLRGRTGEVTASVVQPLSGTARTQYALSFRTGMAMRGAALALGRPDGGEAAVIARIKADPSQRFDVLVNDVPRASVRGGTTMLLQLPAYRSYDVRIRAVGSAMLGYDSNARRITLYPGNVAPLRWKTARQLAVHGRIVLPDGSPVAGAALSAGPNIADSAADGEFLIQLDEEAAITARLRDGRTCTIPVRLPAGTAEAAPAFLALGTLGCTPGPVTSPKD